MYIVVYYEKKIIIYNYNSFYNKMFFFLKIKILNLN